MHSRWAWGAPEFVLTRTQWVPAPMTTVYDFFLDPQNLARITPSWLGFQVMRIDPPLIQQGTLIDYRLRWLGLPYHWRTRIEAWEPGQSFVDTQLCGPYILWHHTHTFTEQSGGILLTDRVRYRLPFGFLGVLMHGIIIRRQLDTIFDYRVQRIAEILSEGVLYRAAPSSSRA